MKELDLQNVEEQKQFEKVTPGGYIIKIESVVDVPEKEYLKFEYDIAEGSHKGHYADLFIARKFWAGKFVKSYKASALRFFKGFISSIENSNNGYKWTSDEQALRGKIVGAVVGLEEYHKNNGEIGTRLYVDQFRSADEIRKGNFKTPELKKLKGADEFGSTVAKDATIPGWE